MSKLPKQLSMAAGAAALLILSGTAFAAPPGKADWNPDPAQENPNNSGSYGYGYYAAPYEPSVACRFDDHSATPVCSRPYSYDPPSPHHAHHPTSPIRP